MTVDELYSLEKYIVNKNMQGFLSPANFMLSNNQAQRSYASYLLGSFQQYTPGRPVARVELGNNATVRQRLTPIIYGYILNNNSDGYTPYPRDYLQTDAMTSMYGFKRIRHAEQDALYSYYNSVIDPIATNPIYLLKDTGFQFYPESTNQARLSYVRNPPDIVWAYTLDGNNRPIYDPANSVDPVWDNLAIYEIVVRTLAIIGVNLQASAVAQYAEQIKREGQ